MKKSFLILTTLFTVLFFALLTFRGASSLSYYGDTLNPKTTGPFESSNSNGRYALVEAMAENHSFVYTKKQASFAAPDITLHNGQYFSVFTPGISFLSLPLYLLGKPFGLQQATTYILNIIFLLLDAFLIFYLTKRISKSLISSSISALVFVLCTNALGFSQSLTQHLPATAILLFSVVNAVYLKGWKSYFFSGMLLGIGLLIDVPVLFIILPPLLYTLSKAFSNHSTEKSHQLKINLSASFFALGILPFVLLFAVYNQATIGSPTKIAQTLGRTETLTQGVKTGSAVAKPEVGVKESGFNLPFDTRNLINGLYVLTVSDERGIGYYSPVLLFSIIGLIFVFTNKVNRKIKNVALLSIGSMLITLLTYSMFGDPWGGWSFGPRYMIPVNALLSIFVGVAVSKYAKKIIFAITFVPALVYSLAVNTAGALTSTSIPSKGEALTLPNPTPYTYQFNLKLISENISGSYFYNHFLSGKVTVTTFAITLICVQFLIIGILYLTKVFKEKEN